MSRDPAGEAGFVLPSVVAVLVVIAAAAALATQHLQTHTKVTAARLDRLRLQGAVDGITRLVAMSLVNERARHRPGLALPEDGRPVACSLPGGGSLSVAIQDQAGLVDLNTSPRPLMEEAFRALGLSDHEASGIAAEIVDDRDPDDAPEPGGGAEAPQYRAQGLPYGPRNAPYDTPDELDRLPSMTPRIAAVLRPAVTVWNTGGGLDPSLNRTWASAGGTAAEGLGAYATRSPHQFYEIRVVAETAGGTRSGRAAILSLEARSTGFGLLTWRTSTAPAAPGATHPACERFLMALGG